MRLSDYLPVTLAVVFGGLACIGVAIASATAIERESRQEVRTALSAGGLDWADASVDGLQVILTGTAPDEAARFAAITAAGSVVDADRVIDAMDVHVGRTPEAPEFLVEILRNDDGVSLIGLVPVSTDREAVLLRAGASEANLRVTDLLDAADYPVPDTWEASLDFALDALALLPRSKISVAAGKITVTAMSDSAKAKRDTEDKLRKSLPEGIDLVLRLSAPRPVLAPFTARFVIDAAGPHFDACSADTTATRDAIIAAAREAGLQGEVSCLIGLGQPSPRWGEAVTQGIAAVAELKGGSVTYSDADVTLVAPKGTRQSEFDQIAGRLQASLPDGFSLTSILPPPDPKSEGSQDQSAEGPTEFVATRSPEGDVQIRGRLPDARTRAAVVSYAQARFGIEETTVAARIGDGLPEGWPIRVLSSLEALSLLNNGSMSVTPDLVEIRGATGNRDAQAEISRLLAANLGEDAEFKLDVRYVEALDPVAALPTPEECVARVNTALATRKITFEPGSTTIDGDALQTIDRVAEALRDCQTVRMEIGGHTDSQGRESMNERLSQQRADAVLNAIMARRVLTSNLTAKGYGESQPIADNGTEEGREANRRIEFRLILPDEETEAADAEAQGGDSNEQN